jgi:hypothetical protein
VFDDRKKYKYHFRCTHRPKQAVTYEQEPKTDVEIERDPLTQHFHCLRCLTHYNDPDSIKVSCRPIIPLSSLNGSLQRHAKKCTGTIIDETVPSQSTFTNPVPAKDFDVSATLQMLSMSQQNQTTSHPLSPTTTPRATQRSLGRYESMQFDAQNPTHSQHSPSPTQPRYASIPMRSPQCSAPLTVDAVPEEYIPPKDLDDSLSAIRASIIPDRYTVVTHARYDFPQLGIVVNTLHKLIICVTCERSLALSTLSAHIKSHGDNIVVARSMAEDLRKEYGLPKVDIARIPEVTGAIQPIFGLQLLEDVYAFCGRCWKGYLDNNGRGMLNHHTQCARHDDDLPDSKGYAQSFSAGRLVAYFQVDPSLIPSRAIPSDAFNLYVKNLPIEDHANEPIRSPLDLHNLSQFLHREHWVDHVAGSTPSELRALIAQPEKDDFLAPLKHHVLEYMRVVQRLIPLHDSFGILQEMARITE